MGPFLLLSTGIQEIQPAQFVFHVPRGGGGDRYDGDPCRSAGDLFLLCGYHPDIYNHIYIYPDAVFVGGIMFMADISFL
jgi:hypothetical protein